MINYHANFDYTWDETTDVCTYGHLEINYGDEVVKFENGCPVKDHAEYVQYGLEKSIMILEGSSFTHLVMDFDDYRYIVDGDGIERLIFDNE